MTDKTLVNAALDNLANAVKACTDYDIITRKMVDEVIDSEWCKKNAESGSQEKVKEQKVFDMIGASGKSYTISRHV